MIGFLAPLLLAASLLILPWQEAASATHARAAPSKSKAKPAKKSAPKARVAVESVNPVSEWENINSEALSLREAIAREPDNPALTQSLALLALRATRSAERNLSRGDEELFDAYREQIETHFPGMRPRIEGLSARGIAAADFALGILDLHGMLGERKVEDACRHRNPQLMRPQLGAAALTAAARLGPRFTAPPARPARALDGHLERDHRTLASLADRELDGGTQGAGVLAGQKGPPDALDSRRHRREIDDHFVPKTAVVDTGFGPAGNTGRPAAERPQDVPAHDLWVP